MSPLVLTHHLKWTDLGVNFCGLHALVAKERLNIGKIGTGF